MFARTQRAAPRYSRSFTTSFILSIFAAINYFTNKDPELTELCCTLALGFALHGIYDMDKHHPLNKTLYLMRKTLFLFWKKTPNIRIHHGITVKTGSCRFI